MTDTTNSGAERSASESASAPNGAGTNGSGQPVGLMDDAKERAGALIDDAKSGVQSAVEDGKDDIADRLDAAAKAIHKSGEQLEGDQDWIAGLVERGADELAALAATLRGNDLKGLMGSLEDLARRQPAVFVGASMAAGFAMVRLGKVAASGMTRDDLPKAPEVHLVNDQA